MRDRTRHGSLVADDSGATMVEYALMIALIAIVCFVAVQLLGTSTSAGFSNSELNNTLGS